ncbi:unnamed protein product [Parascedosporium putredinis]|uniref:Uncharacterized protein n=1 Tax=Parascedosporium putredinis TaxID=1442378 RepID=A0A9P1M6I5_9PEZI|nr:unnamed protein product [Parascedosporium putredinis]CAI7987387.1 unnamed protein product [Parascedosporium putredinis]
MREPLQLQNTEYTISVYKSKDDYEPYYQCPVNSVTDCQVQQLSHRKQGPVLPTLVITVSDKEKKRRSSRAAGLISGKESTHRGFTAPGDRDGPPTAHGSESPSLRSKRSDVSSPTSGIHPSLSHRTLPSHHHYTTGSRADIPPDLPSPAESGAGDQHINELIDGWSSPQARSSSFSSPRAGAPSLDRRHTSVGVSPTINRETILDRAFQLRCIPGSERAVPGEEKLSSLARFDALMRDTEDRRNKDDGVRAKQAQEARRKWEMGGDSSESDDESERETDDEDDDYHLEQDSAGLVAIR